MGLFWINRGIFFHCRASRVDSNPGQFDKTVNFSDKTSIGKNDDMDFTRGPANGNEDFKEDLKTDCSLPRNDDLTCEEDGTKVNDESNMEMTIKMNNAGQQSQQLVISESEVMEAPAQFDKTVNFGDGNMELTMQTKLIGSQNKMEEVQSVIEEFSSVQQDSAKDLSDECIMEMTRALNSGAEDVEDK